MSERTFNAKVERRRNAEGFIEKHVATLRPRPLIACAFALALLLRLLYGLSLNPLAAYDPAAGSDSAWYLNNAYALVAGHDRPNPVTGETSVTDVSRLSSPPLYFVLIGLPQAALSPAAAVVAVRVMQAILSAAVTLFGAGLAYRLTGRVGAGVIAAFALALHPALILESGQILTETLYIFLMMGGLYLYVEASAGEGVRLRPLLLAAALFGLAALTRAVFVAFPVLLAGHLWWITSRPSSNSYLKGDSLATAGTSGFISPDVKTSGYRKTKPTKAAKKTNRSFFSPFSGLVGLEAGRFNVWRYISLRGLGSGVIFLAVFAAVVLMWTAYSVARWNRFVIAGEGLPAFLYIGAAGWDDPEALDARLASELGEAYLEPTSEDYVEAASATILADPLGYLRRRVGELGEAILQPHGTTLFPGASLRDLALGWLRDDRSLSGLIALTQGNFFWYKLLLYLVHYIGLLAGVIGLWRCRRAHATAPLLAFILYTTLVHLALQAIPRYLFPTMVVWWVFAAAGLNRKLKVES